MMNGTTELEKQTGYVEITPKPVTITVHDQEKDFGEVDPEITYEVEGVLDTSELVLIRTHRYSQVVNDELTEADEQVGFYQARLVATFVHNPNYKVKVNLGNFTIKDVVTTEPEPTEPEPTEPEPTEPIETEPVETEETTIISVITKETEKPTTHPETVDKDGIPITGETTNFMLYIAIASLALLIIVRVAITKRNRHKE